MVAVAVQSTYCGNQMEGPALLLTGCPCGIDRKCYQGMSDVGKKLVGVLKERGLEELDVSNALIALTIDIIGTVGFHHEFNTVDTINVMSMSPMLQVITVLRLRVEFVGAILFISSKSVCS